jgi:hypothetical protein
MTDSRNARDDRGLERLLREALPPGDSGEDVPCLDPDTVAAWYEGALTAAERASAEMHAAGCARCQAMLAVMLRTEPPTGAHEPSAVRRWMMMLGPALAAAAAVTIWFAADRRSHPVEEPAASPTAVGEPPAAPATPLPARSTAAPMTEAAKKEAELALADAVRQNEGRTDARRPAPTRPALVPPAHSLTREEKARDKDIDSIAPRAVAEPPAAPPPPAGLAETVQVAQAPPAAAKPADERQRAEPAPMQSQAQYTQQQAVPRRPEQQQAADVVSRDAAARSPRAETDRAAGRGGASAGSQANELISAAATAADVFAFRSPDDSAWWRVTSGRVAQQSTDKGATWATRYAADEKTSLTAGSAASPTTVWMVGRAGTVLVTTDGRTWRRIPFPEAVDLIAVTASGSDGRRATVISADGRSFATADAGASWSRK